MGTEIDGEYEKGVQALKEDRFEDAVQLIGQGLQGIIDQKGVESLEAASAFHRYGSALFYRAQEESDVFGATLQAAARENGAGPSSAAATGTDSDAAAGEEVGEGDDGETDGEGEDEEEDGDGDDMQLAWENLEVARRIYTEHKSTHVKELADVHMLLADLASEQESFEEALKDLRLALDLLQPVVKENDRVLAELHFKASLTLQFLQQPEEALKEAGLAIKVCGAALEAQKQAEGEAAQKEAASMEAVLEELKDREEELKEAIAELQKTKSTLRNAFQQAVGGAPGPAAGSQVIDLGVVGQGKKRIAVDHVAPQNGNQVGADQAAKTKQKRSLEDLMGGDNSTVGFKFATPPEGDLQGGQAKKQTLEAPPQVASDVTATLKAEAPKAALPAFLSNQSVEQVYGGTPDAGKPTNK